MRFDKFLYFSRSASDIVRLDIYLLPVLFVYYNLLYLTDIFLYRSNSLKIFPFSILCASIYNQALMDCNVSNHMTGTSIILPLATIEEDIEEIDESMEHNIDKNGKRVLIDKSK